MKINKIIAGLVAGSYIALVPTVVLAEMIVVSADGTYLGRVTSNPYDSESICNIYGTYGSSYGSGIFNTYGTHGGSYSLTGAYNRQAQKPPALIENNKIVGFVTKNPRFRGRIDPDILKATICDQ